VIGRGAFSLSLGKEEDLRGRLKEEKTRKDLSLPKDAG